MSFPRPVLPLFLLVLLLPRPAAAQNSAPAAPRPGVPVLAPVALDLPSTFNSAAPPELPATVSRDGRGHITVRAVRLSTPLRVDGVLDEELYQRVMPVSDFIQTEPRPGTPATERTEAWVSFDDKNVYVSVRAFESQPSRMVVNEMRRDSTVVLQNEHFGFAFDTFYDRRNNLSFSFNPIGGRMDGQTTNESQYSVDWNTVWSLEVRKVEGGWTGEAAVPFKSLRYAPGRQQIWGIQLRRNDRWKNEMSYLTVVPSGLGSLAMTRTSASATLVGIEAPPPSAALELKPFVTANLSTDLAASPRLRNHGAGDIGFDGKYGITRNLTADFTYNTDFAQVEADEQQVNLTRFNLLFPEKRDFFLENQGLFNFGGSGTNTSSNGLGNNSGGDVPFLFYSRRIGLDQGRQVPVEVGGRLTGRLGRFSVGALDIQTDSVPAAGIRGANFGVVRLRRDILRRSAVGLLATRRSATPGVDGSADTVGVDGAFNFYQNVTINTYWAKTHTPGLRDDDVSYRGQLNYAADRYGAQLERLRVGSHFAPAIGFVRRDDMRKDYAFLRFSPRPKRMKRIRKFGYEASATYIEDGTGRLESRERRGLFSVEFQTSDRVEISYADAYEFVPTPFALAPQVRVPSAGYDFGTFRTQLTVGQQRRASGNWYVEHGPFYGGDRTAVGYSSARVKLSPHLALEPGFSVNRVTLPFGDFTATLVSTRATYTITPLMFVSGLAQYNSSNSTLSANVRLRWEYQPGSELFLVYNEGRSTLGPGRQDLQNRAIVLKINRLFRF